MLHESWIKASVFHALDMWHARQKNAIRLVRRVTDRLLLRRTLLYWRDNARLYRREIIRRTW